MTSTRSRKTRRSTKSKSAFTRFLNEVDNYGKDSEDEADIMKIIQRDNDILVSVSSDKNFEKVDLNKLNTNQILQVKKFMDTNFQKNSLKPGDSKFQYDRQEEFNPEESNEWDKSKGKNSFVANKSSLEEQPKEEAKETKLPAPRRVAADEEFDMDFDEDFNDDLDDFDD